MFGIFFISSRLEVIRFILYDYFWYWYQASGGANLAKNLSKTGEGTISAATQATVDTLDMGTVKLSVSDPVLVADSKSYGTSAVAISDSNRSDRTALALNLATYSSGWVHKFLPTGQTDNANAITTGYNGESGLVDWKCFSFTITYDLSDVVVTDGMDLHSQFNILHPNAESLDISVGKTTGTSNAKNYGVFAISADAPSATWDPTSINATSLSAVELGAGWNASVTVYVYVYCDGATHLYSVNDPNANFTLTVGAH